ncbi:MvaI/BcnI family restriction endonuclease [Stutzerimonas stutzeri]|uniref:MvaI/BcnI restriction endonuclease family protein n=1 Tax=Stutzerimonas stutzeri TaxID=316 RepID=A0A5S5BCG7_STUST|nr:MvaI/BcnI family restriction endonuclease [Stutzerimonas stutzeri]TYP64016.1 MvaI/BcnI restriction endonuclease family protein [Stutzerimonas stutzeri]
MSILIDSPLERVADVMRRHGARHVVFKLLANNDNSKQQVYFGGDFDVLRMIPHGDLVGSYSERDGVIFKAPLNFSWLHSSLSGSPMPAPGAQLIFYPRYPEVRMSGFLRGCIAGPNALMQPLSPEERVVRMPTPRCLILGICEDGRILGYVGAWESSYAIDAIGRIQAGSANNVASVFYELRPPLLNTRAALLQKLSQIRQMGAIPSCRLDASGVSIPYIAQNGAGYTLESMFGIVPNGRSEPDFLGWELKAHSGGAVTLMTPEPDSGSYSDCLQQFLIDYGRCGDIRRDFTGIHRNGVLRGKLTMRMEGYDSASGELTSPDGGLMLRDEADNLAAGWTFNKLISHWSKKHGQTAYITYSKGPGAGSQPSYSYGPDALLCQGADLKHFLGAIHQGTVYYDPGINQKVNASGKWISKKRSQFRVAWKNVGALYEQAEIVTI